MPGYSTGCFACRQRKVKCDERKPGCSRCASRRNVCPGYRDTQDLVFCSMNSSAAAKVGHLIVDSYPDTHSTPSGRLSPDKQHMQSSLTILQPSADVEGLAVAHFFHNYVLLPSRGRLGYLEFLPQLFAQNDQNVNLKHALLGAAMASYANIYRLGDVQNTAQRHYGLALRSTACTLNDPIAAKTDCSLAAIILLQKFEIISGLKDRTRDPHQDALFRLHQLRDPDELAVDIGQRLSFLIQSRTFMTELDRVRPNVAHFVDDDITDGYQAPRNKFWQMVGRMSGVCRRMQQLVSNKHQNILLAIATKEVFQETFSVHAELRAWPESLSAKDKLRVTQSSKMQDSAPPFPPSYYVFENIQHCALWIAFWCMQLRFLQHMKVFIETCGVDNEMLSFSTTYLVKQLHGDQLITVDQICGSCAYVLGELGKDNRLQPAAESKSIGAYYLLRALHIANQLDDLSTDQRTFILDRMLQIGHSKGIAQALRARDRWLETHPDTPVATQN